MKQLLNSSRVSRIKRQNLNYVVSVKSSYTFRFYIYFDKYIRKDKIGNIKTVLLYINCLYIKLIPCNNMQ